MGTIRSDGMSMKDPDDDESFQMLVGDVIRILIEMRKGSSLGQGGTAVGGTAADIGALIAANNLSDLVSAAIARTNLGLGSAATIAVPVAITDGGTGAITAPLARAALGSTTVGDAVFIAANAAAGQTALGLGTMSTQDSNNVSISGGAITGITDLAVADGGTGASTATTARSNLGATTTGDALFIAANAAAGRTALSLGTIATQNANAVTITGGTATLTSAVLGSGTSALTLGGVGCTTYLTGNLGPAITFDNDTYETGIDFIRLILNAGGGGSTNKTGKLAVWANGTNTFTFGGSAATTFTFAAACPVTVSGDASIAGAAKTLGFFGSAGTTKTAVSDPSAIVTTQTAGATYTANEQTMLGNLKTDVTNLRTKLLALIDALQGYNQI